MNYCKKCQTILLDDQKYCSNCGSFVELEQDMDKETTDITEPVVDIGHEAEDDEKLIPTPPDIRNIPDIPTTSTASQDLDSKSAQFDSSFDDEAQMGLLKKISLIALSVFIAPGGLITGLIMMSGTDRIGKEFGQIMVIISVTVFVALTVCCCAFAVLGTIAYS